MQKSEQVNELFTALSKAQGAIKHASFDATNPFFKRKYATLGAVWNACRDALTANGLAVVQFPTTAENGIALETIITHSSGQWMSETMSAPLGQARNPVQGMGSTIKYLRRYALASVLGIVADEDNDGNTAPAQSAKPAQKTTLTAAKVFGAIQERTGAYYKHIKHLENAIGEMPDLNDSEAVKAYGEAAIKHAADKHATETEGQGEITFDSLGNGGAAYAD